MFKAVELRYSNSFMTSTAAKSLLSNDANVRKNVQCLLGQIYIHLLINIYIFFIYIYKAADCGGPFDSVEGVALLLFIDNWMFEEWIRASEVAAGIYS